MRRRSKYNQLEVVENRNYTLPEHYLTNKEDENKITETEFTTPKGNIDNSEHMSRLSDTRGVVYSCCECRPEERCSTLKCKCLSEGKRCRDKFTENCINDGLDQNDGFNEVVLSMFPQDESDASVDDGKETEEESQVLVGDEVEEDGSVRIVDEISRELNHHENRNEMKELQREEELGDSQETNRTEQPITQELEEIAGSPNEVREVRDTEKVLEEPTISGTAGSSFLQVELHHRLKLL